MKKTLVLRILLITLISILVTGGVITAILLSKNNHGTTTLPPNTLPTTTEEPLTDIVLFKDGVSPYTIVIPKEASSDIIFASNELITFFEEATGYILPIITDEGLSYNTENYYFSIGDTTLLQAANKGITYAEYGFDALNLVRENHIVFMTGSNDTGTIYAVYEFLERTFNFEVYANDEWKIDNVTETVYLKDFNVTEVPLFPKRSVGLFTYSNNETFRNRMRQNLYNDDWIYWSHSHFKILPPDQYLDLHPEWYSVDQTQLCLTNDEMRAEFTRVVIDLIKNNPDKKYIMLGQEDINTFCTRPESQAMVDIYGESGVMMRFVNLVADDVQAYIDEYEPGRIFFLGTFGYHKTEFAPVKTDSNGNLVPIDETVIPRDNVMVMVAPIRACNDENLYGSCNQDSERIFKSWDAVAHDHLFVWIYNKIFANYFLPFNNFSTLVDNYQILADLGVQFVYHQGNKETPAAALQELSSYVQAKLMWDVNQNPEALASDFIVNYYKDAAEPFQAYFDLLRMNYEIWQVRDKAYVYNSGSISLNTYNSTYWTRDYLDSLNNLFDQMMANIDHYKTTDPDLYETLYIRIMKERLTIYMLYLNFYFDEFTYDEAGKMIDDFEYVCTQTGITVWREKYGSRDVPESLISVLVASWRTLLQQK